MKIIISGAGEVGFHLARLLSSELHDTVLIDTSQDVLDYAQSHLDVLAINGDSTSIKTLIRAEVKNADLLFAVTSSENTNIITAVLGKRMGAAKTIARINKNEYLAKNVQQHFKSVGIDELISPKMLAANEVCRLVKEAALTDIFEFENGKLSLIGIHLDERSPIIDRLIADTKHFNPDHNFKPIALKRGIETIIPRGSTRLRANDYLYFITQKEGIDKILEIAGKLKSEMENLMILGGSDIGLLSAQKLETEYKVKLIEKNKDKCLTLAEQLNKTLVINGDGSNLELLTEEGLPYMDAFIALTNHSEINIIACLVAKNHKVQKTIALVDNTDYIHLAQTVGIDTLINKKLLAANEIFRYIRKGAVQAVASLRGVDAEVIEYVVNKKAKITKRPIRNIDFPKGAVIGGVIRNNESYIPYGDFNILPGDKVVVFTLPAEIGSVERFFR